MFRTFWACAFLTVFAGCEHVAHFGPAGANTIQDVTALDKKEWKNYIGATVEVHGMARNAMRGAYLSGKGDQVLAYVDDLMFNCWPSEFFHKKVVAKGILIYHPKREPDGAAQILGPYYSLGAATWSLVE